MLTPAKIMLARPNSVEEMPAICPNKISEWTVLPCRDTNQACSAIRQAIRPVVSDIILNTCKSTLSGRFTHSRTMLSWHQFCRSSVSGSPASVDFVWRKNAENSQATTCREGAYNFRDTRTQCKTHCSPKDPTPRHLYKNVKYKLVGEQLEHTDAGPPSNNGVLKVVAILEQRP